MPNRIFLLLFLYSICCFILPEAGAQQYPFRHYQVENGLSNNAVICCLQDQRGFMWFGTKDGLNRFDGYNFRTFRNVPGDTTTIGSNFIRCLYEDEGGTIWAGTEKGLYRYNAVSERFSLLSVLNNSVVQDIKGDKAGNLWFIMNFTLCKYHEKSGRLTTFDAGLYFQVTSIGISANGEVWASTPTGFIKQYDAQQHSFISYPIIANGGTSNWIERIHCTADGNIWIGTATQGAKRFNRNTHSITHLLAGNDTFNSLFVRNFVQATDTSMWLATESGIVVYNTVNGHAVLLSKSYNDPFSISDNAVYSFWKDKEGGIWACTYFGGVNYYARQFTPFKKLFPKKGENSLSGNVIREIHEDGQGNLWIGTEDAGLNKWDKKTGKFTNYFPTGRSTDISYSNIHGMLVDGNQLWIGTFEHGLDIMDIRTAKVIKHYNAGPDSNALKSNFIYCISKRANGDIVLGTTIAAYRYNRQKGNFSLLPAMPMYNWYSYLLEDKEGIIWAATYGNGVRYYDTKTGNSGNYTFNAALNNSIGSDRVNSIFEDSNGNLWFATEEGLSRLDKKRRMFTNYTTKNGLPANFTLSILEDDFKNLWITTSKGLVSIHLATDKVKVYTSISGILNDQFNFNSAYKDASGNLYFGSVKGLVSFNPASFAENRFSAPVYITGFQVFNKELSVGEKGSPLQKSITYTDKITLHYDESTFSIDFAALGFTAPEMAEYTFRMKGLDSNWVLLKRNRKAYFTRLNPGTYRFEVKAANSSGLWNTTSKELVIEILPPWWKSRWAYLSYFLLGVCIIYFTTRRYRKSLEAKNKRRYELLEIAKEKEIFLAKIEFFTNVAHEIKTPLSLIKAPLERVMEKADKIPELRNHLKIMDRNTDRLIALTNQLLDFRQTEINGFSLNFVRANINQLLEETFASFKPLAEEKNLAFQLTLPPAAVYAYVDLEAFNKILYNLFSNGIKYADSKVMAHLLTVMDDDTHFTITLKNDGFLIPPEMSEKIFEPFFRMSETIEEQGSGIGLALSRSLAQLHNGQLYAGLPEKDFNVFTLTLPLHQQNEFNLGM